MHTWYRRIQVLSLDIAAGALASGCLAAWWYEVEMPWAWYLVLPLAVWVIYTADHLLDAYRLGKKANTPRHLFHGEYLVPIFVLWLLAAVVCAVLALGWLPYKIQLFGLVLGGFTAAHFFLVWLIGARTSRWLAKELGVALIYAAGVWAGPWTMAGNDFSLFSLIPFMQFFLLALTNLLLFAWFEYHEDEAAGHTSYVRAIGKPSARKLLALIQAVCLALALVLLATDRMAGKALSMELVLLSMLGILSGIYFAPEWFSERSRYRIWGDFVFLMPFLLWVIN